MEMERICPGSTEGTEWSSEVRTSASVVLGMPRKRRVVWCELPNIPTKLAPQTTHEVPTTLLSSGAFSPFASATCPSTFFAAGSLRP